MKLAAAGAIASQLNTFLSSVGLLVERPACRCSAITVTPVSLQASDVEMAARLDGVVRL